MTVQCQAWTTLLTTCTSSCIVSSQSYHRWCDDVQLRSEAEKPISRAASRSSLTISSPCLHTADIDWHTTQADWLTGWISAIMSILTRTDPNHTNHVGHGIRRFLPVVWVLPVCRVLGYWFSLTVTHLSPHTHTWYVSRSAVYEQYLHAHGMSITNPIIYSLLPGHAYRCPYLYSSPFPRTPPIDMNVSVGPVLQRKSSRHC